MPDPLTFADARALIEDESHIFGECRYCGVQGYPVDPTGARLDPFSGAVVLEWRYDHADLCPVTILGRVADPPAFPAGAVPFGNLPTGARFRLLPDTAPYGITNAEQFVYEKIPQDTTIPGRHFEHNAILVMNMGRELGPPFDRISFSSWLLVLPCDAQAPRA